MIPQQNLMRRDTSEFNEFISLKVNDIKELSEAYFELLQIADNTHTAKAEQFLLDELQRVCSHLATRLDHQGNDDIVYLNQKVN
jgi:hypothetical protein